MRQGQSTAGQEQVTGTVNESEPPVRITLNGKQISDAVGMWLVSKGLIVTGKGYQIGITVGAQPPGEINIKVTARELNP